MSRTVALTGATGFVGSALARRLHSAGWIIRALIRSPASPPVILSDIPIQWISGDLHDSQSLTRLVDGADDVVHCAGLVQGVSLEHFLAVNADGVERLARAACGLSRLPRFLLVSSLAAREPNISPYAASKRQGETVLASIAQGMGWVIVRPPPVYGPGDRALWPLFNLMGKGIAPKLGGDAARFSLIFIDDLAEAIVMCLACDVERGTVFEVHDGHLHGYRWDDVIDTIREVCECSVFRFSMPEYALHVAAAINIIASRMTGSQPMLTHGKVRELRHHDWVCDNAVVQNMTAWRPLVSLPEGLRRTFHSRSPASVSPPPSSTPLGPAS